MRIKLIFLFSLANNHKLSKHCIQILSGFKKIVYPVNLNDITFIRDLKTDITKFILKKGIACLEVDSLLLNDFLLMDEFEVNSLLNNDDEIKVNLTQICQDAESESESESESEFKLISIKKEKSTSQKELKKKMNYIQIDSDKESEVMKDFEKNKKFLGKKQKIDANIVNLGIKKNDKVTTFISQSDSDSDLPSQPSQLIPKATKLQKKDENIITPKITSFLKQNNKPKFNNNNINNITNTNNYFKPKKDKFPATVNQSESYLKAVEKVDIPTIESNYDLIPSDKLDDLNFLYSHYPTLFVKGTAIIFRIFELSLESGGPSASGYKKGLIDEFISEFRCFVIKLPEAENEGLIDVYGSIQDDTEANVISVYLKDFIELRVEKSEKNNPVTETEKIEGNNKEVIGEAIINEVKESEVKEGEVKEIEVKESITTTATQNLPKSKPEYKVSAYNKIVLPHIKKQVEFYFSDKNYYKDAFLKEKSAQDEDNFIDIDIIMGFNKLKTLTNKREEIISALKDSNMVEFNSDNTKIRKKNIKREFM